MAGRTKTARWVGSPFEWIMALPSRTKGRVGELLVENWLKEIGHRVGKPTNSGHDRTVDGRKVEVKVSTLWADNDTYTFQQLRDQDYEFVFLLGLSPNRVDGWFAPKEIVFEHAVPQHGGATGVDTRWLTFIAASPPAWLAEYGGTLNECREGIVRQL